MKSFAKTLQSWTSEKTAQLRRNMDLDFSLFLPVKGYYNQLRVISLTLIAMLA